MPKSRYWSMTLICGKCEMTIPASIVAISPDGDAILKGFCDNCNMPTALETTLVDIQVSCLKVRMITMKPDLDFKNVKVRGRIQ